MPTEPPSNNANQSDALLPIIRAARTSGAVADRMQAIKAQLHQRQLEHARRNTQQEKPTPQSLEQLMEAKLMQLRKEQELQLAMHPKKDLPRVLPELPPAEFQALADRTSAFEHFAKEKRHWEVAERAAEAKVAAADAMAETVKDKAMELIHNGLNYCFDDRAVLWRSIVAARTESETLRHDADTTLSTLEQTKLVNPYASYSTLALPETNAADGTSSPDAAQCDVWLIGRRGVIESKEKNSDTIIYYGAYFDAADELRDTPKDGMRWLPCSDHAMEPAPVVQHKRATVESWIVSGAGLAAVNGIYVLSGTYDGASKYTSVMGLELFRKRFSLETHGFGNTDDMAVSGSTGESLPLPAKFRAIYNDRDFRVMQQIGSWLATQEVKAKTRAEAIKESHRKVQQSGSDDASHHITIQPMHTEAAPMVPSRPQVVSRLCRAWVLMQCHVPVCPQRHYFISHQERDTMKIWQLDTDAKLDMDILQAITARELTIERVKALASKAMAKYMANMQVETAKQVQKVVMALNGLRLATVHVIEAIQKWRQHVQLMGRVTSLHTAEDDEAKYGWSASITVTTGKLLYKGSNAFHSKVKRYCRDADVDGEAETQVRYLGYFPTKVEAEVAYDTAVVTEAKRLHTTVDHMPKKRYVFLSCGVHFSIESDDVIASKDKKRKKSSCIECRAKVNSNSDPWIPTYLWHGANYILKMGNDLDFLEDITPLQAHVGSNFPLLGNPFLIPRSVIQDPEKFVTLAVPESPHDGASLGPHLDVTVHENRVVTWTNPETEETFVASPSHVITTEATTETRTRYEILDMPRLQRAQKVFLHEVQRTNTSSDAVDGAASAQSLASTTPLDEVAMFRRVQALYWDRCAALRIEHIRPARAFRQPNVWCRLDAGEWANFRVRGKHLRQLLFHQQLHDTGTKTHSNRRVFIQKLRAYMQLGWDQVDRQDMEAFLLEAEVLRGDVVKLEASNLVKFMAKFDRINDAVGLAQRWWRHVVGKWRARSRSLALRTLAQLRLQFQAVVCTLAEAFVTTVASTAVRGACAKIERPAFSTTLKLDGEHVVVSWHSLVHASPALSTGRPCKYCLRQAHQASIHMSGFKFQKDQVICCCRAAHSPERLLARAYNPSTSQVYRLKLGNERARQLLRPRVDGFLGRACDLKPLPTDRILNYDPKLMGGRWRTCWEPIHEAQVAQTMALGVEKEAQYHEKVAQTLLRKLTAWRALHTNNLQVKKHTWVAFQKAKAQSDRAENAFQDSVLQTNEAMAFSERARTSLTEEQPWDPLENANNWTLLVSKRLANRDAADKAAQLEVARMEWFHAEMNEASTRACTAEAKDRYDAAAAVAKCVRSRANEFRAMANTAQLMMVTALRTLSSLLALRFTSSLPIRRNLVVLDTKQWHFHAKPSKLHTLVTRRDFDYNLLVARAKKVCSEPIRHTSQTPQHWIVEVRTLAETASLDAGVLVSMYRPRESKALGVWVEARFLMLLMTRLRFRDPLAIPIQTHMKTAATLTMHGNAASRKLLLMTECAKAAVHLVKLNAFSGEVTVGRVDFFHVREALEMKLVQSHWWHDLCRGRKRGRGDEVYRQATNVDGRLCHVVVFENWGDLTVQIYEPRSRRYMTCVVTLADTIRALKGSPFKLQHWLLCVRTNRYSDVVFQPILQHIVLAGASASLHVPKSAGTIVHRGVRFVRNRYILVTMRETLWQHLTITGTGLDEASNIHGIIQIDPSGRRAMFPRCSNPKDEYASLMDMIALEPKAAPISLQEGAMVKAAFDGFNAWADKSAAWRNPLSKVHDQDVRAWACLADSGCLHTEWSSEWSLVLRRTAEFEDSVRPLVYDRSVEYDKGGIPVHAKLEVFPRHGDFYLRLRAELFTEWEIRLQQARRFEMDAEESYARKAVAYSRRRHLVTTLEIWSAELRSIQQRLRAMEGVFSLLQQCHLDKQRTLLASQFILSMEIEEDASESTKQYHLSVGHGLMWVHKFPYAPSTVYLDPPTKQHKVPADLVLAKMSKVAMFARPIQVEFSIQLTDDDDIWKFEAYGRAIGVVVTYHVNVLHVLQEHTFCHLHIPRDVARTRALAWLCGLATELGHHDSLWTTAVHHMNLSPWQTICQLMTNLHPLVQFPDELLECSGILHRSPRPARGVVRYPVLDHAFSALLDGLQVALNDVEQSNASQIGQYHNMLGDPFEMAVVDCPLVQAPARAITPRPPTPRSTWQLVIPAAIGEPLEEVFIQEPVDFTELSSLLGSANLDLLDALHGHIIVLADQPKDAQVNVRASGLTGSLVYGRALYLCRSPHLVDRLVHIQPTKCSSKRQGGQKGAKWRAYANDRMRATRQARPSHSYLPLEDSDAVEDQQISTWHPSNCIQTSLVARISKKELEYVSRVDADLATLPSRTVDRFLEALEYSTLTWHALDTKLVFSDILVISVVDSDPLAMMTTISVKNLTAPTCLIVTAKDSTERFGTPQFQCTIPWDPLEKRLTHGSAWATFAHNCVSDLILHRCNGQVNLSQRQLVASTLYPEVATTRRTPPPVNLLQYSALSSQVPANDMSKLMGSQRLNKHLRSSVLDRMRKRFDRVQLASAKSALEWPHMAEEDAFSAEFRGILTLPLKQLHKLCKAYDTGNQESRSLQGTAADQRRAVLSALGSSSLRIQGEKDVTPWVGFHSFAEWWRVAEIERRRREPPPAPGQPPASPPVEKATQEPNV